MPENTEQILKTYLEMPADFWVKILIVAVVALVFLVVFKKLAQVAQVIVVVVVFVAMGVIGFKWVCYRGEPEFLTPAVDVVAGWFGK